MSLAEVLEMRDRRATLQRELLAAGGSLISFTLNIPGPVKRFPAADRAFDQAASLLRERLAAAGLPILREERRDQAAGREAFFLLPAPAEAVKELTLTVEETHPLGRFFDIDVLDAAGRHLSREEFGRPPRRCYLCGGDAKACGRSRAHGAAELSHYVREAMERCFEEEDSGAIAGAAQRALLTEVSAAPKPGLVDRLDPGAHRDMDLLTFVDSSVALSPWLRRFALCGIRGRALAPEALFTQLRWLGIQAERDMFAATGGVNTHKGLIFSMAILCGGLGRLWGGPWTLEELADLCGRIAAPALGDLTSAGGKARRTHGEELYLRAGVTGIRGEMAAGFPSVRAWGLPALRRALDRGRSLNDSAVEALLSLMAHVEDTNVLARAGGEEARLVRREAAEALARMEREGTTAAAADLNRSFIHRNISPGGCADLLALTLLLHFVGARERGDGHAAS